MFVSLKSTCARLQCRTKLWFLSREETSFATLGCRFFLLVFAAQRVLFHRGIQYFFSQIFPIAGTVHTRRKFRRAVCGAEEVAAENRAWIRTFVVFQISAEWLPVFVGVYRLLTLDEWAFFRVFVCWDFFFFYVPLKNSCCLISFCCT